VPKPLPRNIENLNVLFTNHPLYQPLREHGFTRSNLTSIVGSTREQAQFVAVASSLVNHLDVIKGIQKSTSFKVSNIVSILSKSRLHVVAAIEALDENKDKVTELTRFGFSTNNLSCILTGTATSVGRGLESLIQHKELVLEFIKLGFTINNVAFMLVGTGICVGHVIKALAHHKDTLQELLNHRFSHNEISSMLGGSKTSMGQALNGLTKHKNTLIELAKEGFPTKYLCSSLKGQGEKLGHAIAELAKNKESLAGIMRTKPNTNIKSVKLTKDDQSTASSTDSNFPSWVMKEDLVNGGAVPPQSAEANIWGRKYFDAESDSVSDLEAWGK
jgi:hypothetical protein